VALFLSYGFEKKRLGNGFEKKGLGTFFFRQDKGGTTTLKGRNFFSSFFCCFV